MTKRVRVGIIGTSWWTESMFLPSLVSHPAVTMVAICGRNRERGESLAQQYGIAEVYTDYRRLIKEATIDAIVIAAPDDLHSPMTMAALDAGLHVLCEKPMALKTEHAQQMTDKAQALGVKHMVLFTWRWLPIFQYVKQLIDDGYIGRCYHANFRFLTGFGRNTNYGWRSDGQRSNGVTSDLGAHMIDFAHWFVGDIRRVNAHLSTFIARPNSDDPTFIPAHDAANISLEFDDQGQGMIQVTTMAHGADRVFEIVAEFYGEAGSLEANLTAGAGVETTLRGARQHEDTFSELEIPDAFLEGIDPTDLFSPFAKQAIGARLFIDSILEDRLPLPNFYDGLKVQQVIEATLNSHESGGWATV